MKIFTCLIRVACLGAVLFCTRCAPLHPGIRGEERPYRYPELSKTEISLDGEFRFITDPENLGLLNGYHQPSFNHKNWREIHAPATWESQGFTIKHPGNEEPLPYNGLAWYRKEIAIPEDWTGRSLTIDLGRVDDREICFWNGNKIGESKGLQFENRFSIPPDIVRYGKKNLLAVRVFDTGGEGGIVTGPLTLRPELPWKEISLSVETPGGLFIYEPNTPIPIDLILKNPVPAPLDISLSMTIRDFEEIVTYHENCPIRLNEGMNTVLSMTIPPQERGHYDCTIDIFGSEEMKIKTFRTSFCVLAPPVRFTDPSSSPFALGGGALFHIDFTEHPTVGERRLSQHARIGALWGRNDLWWGVIEPERGSWDFSKLDSAVDLFEKHGINLLGILCYSTEWLKGRAPVTDEQVRYFAEYSRKMAERYRGRIKYWEVWNEPNIRPFWEPRPDPEDYANLLRAASKAVREAAPEARVIGMVTSLTDLDFIEKALKKGAGKYMDVVSVHPYQLDPPTRRGPSTELGKIRRLRELLDRYECSRPIWITECGWQSLGGVTEQKQAEYLVKLYVLTLAEGLVERIYWFNLTDWGKRSSPEGGHFGLVHMDHSPKPSFAAFYTMVEQLHDFKEVKRLVLPDETAGFEFSFQEGRRVRIYWNEKGPREVAVPEAARMINLVGKNEGNTRGRITVDQTPRYIVWDTGKYSN